MPVPLKYRPEHIRHGQADVGVRDVGQLPPLIPLPGFGGSMPATGAGARLARVIDDPFFTLRGKDLCAEGLGSAIEYLSERLTHGWARVIAIPRLPVHLQDPVKRWDALVAHWPFSGAGIRSTPG